MDKTRYTSSSYGKVLLVPQKHYAAFYPKYLPQTVEMTPAVITLLADAESALGKLSGVGRMLPNPKLLITPYLLREALASTKIEGTQTNLVEVLENQASGGMQTPDVEEVSNYIKAAEAGQKRLATLPLSIRFLSEIHKILLDGVRGKEKQPGIIRTTQNWIGDGSLNLNSATFVPPPPDEVGNLLSDWEKFVHSDVQIPVLAQSALLHYQFETIHPFLDGNGRIGRLVIIFHLVDKKRLPGPLLYMSPYFDKNRSDYYAKLQGVREKGDLESWLLFFLRGVEQQAIDAVNRAQKLLERRDFYKQQVVAITRSSHANQLVDVLLSNPILTTRTVEKELEVSKPTAIRWLKQFSDLAIVERVSEGSRGQARYRAQEILQIIESDESNE